MNSRIVAPHAIAYRCVYSYDAACYVQQCSQCGTPIRLRFKSLLIEFDTIRTCCASGYVHLKWHVTIEPRQKTYKSEIVTRPPRRPYQRVAPSKPFTATMHPDAHDSFWRMLRPKHLWNDVNRIGCDRCGDVVGIYIRMGYDSKRIYFDPITRRRNYSLDWVLKRMPDLVAHKVDEYLGSSAEKKLKAARAERDEHLCDKCGRTIYRF